MNTPQAWENIRIFGEVSFTHQMLPKPPAATRIVTGRLDYGIGRVLPGSHTNRQKQRARRFQSLLLILEAKGQHTPGPARAQLLTYMGSLHESRIRNRRSDTSVYGVGSDGFSLEFVKIMPDGGIKFSKRFDTNPAGLQTILGCLKHVLEVTAEISPNSSLKLDGDDVDYTDYQISVDHVPSSEDDEDDSV